MPIMPGTERAIMKLADLLPELNKSIQLLTKAVMVLQPPAPDVKKRKGVYEKVVDDNTFKLERVGSGGEQNDGSIVIHLDRMPDPKNGKLLIIDEKDTQ